MTFLTNEIFLIAVTFGFFFITKLLQRKTGMIWLNPLLITIILLILFLKIMGVSYETYHKGGAYIEFWLKPAVVALGVPLYLHLESIKKHLVPILLSQLAGCFTGVISVVLCARVLGASKEVILSLAAKSVTTPIAMEITKTVNGIPSLTAAVVICVGLFGAMAGFRVMRIFRINTDASQGLAMGAAAHAIGTDRAMNVSSLHGAYASLGLILNGIFTAIFTPAILAFFGCI